MPARVIGGGGAAALVYPPLDPGTFGPSMWLSSGYASGAPAEFSMTGSSVTTALDHAGGGASMTGNAVTWATSGGPAAGRNGNTARAYLDMKPKVSGSSLKGTTLFGLGGTTNFVLPWTMIVCLTWQGDGTTGSGLYDAFMLMGPQGTSPTKNGILATNNTAPYGNVWFGSAGQTPGFDQGGAIEAFGTQPLQNGTPGTTCPSTQVLALVHTRNEIDGTWEVEAYLDAVLIGRSATASGAGWTIASDNFGLCSLQDGAYLGPEYWLYDAAWYPYALTQAQLRSVTLWCLNEVNAPATVPCLVAGPAASVTEGFVATGDDGWFQQLAASYASAYGQTITTTFAAAVDGSSVSDWSQRYRKYWQAVLDQYAVRSVRRVALLADVASNELSGAGNAASVVRAQRYYPAAAHQLHLAGFDTVIVAGMMPYNVTWGGSGPTSFSYLSDELNAWFRTYPWASYVFYLDWRLTSSTTPVPTGLGSAYATVGAAALALAANIPTDVHPNDTGHAGALAVALTLFGKF
jgi:hypothetical protein